MIKDLINDYLDKGVTKKTVIYTKVVLDTGVTRSVVRRVARDIRIELAERLKVLQDSKKKIK